MRLSRILLGAFSMLLFASVASGHSFSAIAKVTYESSRGTVKIELVDPYANQIPGARVRAGLAAPGQKAPAMRELQETVAGTHLGTVETNNSGVLHFVVDWPGERWTGQAAVVPGSPLESVAVEMTPVEETARPWWQNLIMPGAGFLLLAGAWWSVSRKGSKR